MRTTVALLVAIMLACPALSEPVAMGTSTGEVATSSTTVVDEWATNGHKELPTGPLEAPDLVCAPTPEFCWNFAQWCPFIFDEDSCLGVDPNCYDSGDLCSLCEAAAEPCKAVFGKDSPTCTKGIEKCKAVALVPGCACQPAVFPCAASEEACMVGWKFSPGGYCRPPCENVNAGSPTDGGAEGECGPADYATCAEDGYCSPGVLVLCL